MEPPYFFPPPEMPPYSSGLPPHFTLVSAQTSPPQRSLLEPSLPPHPGLFCSTALLFTYSFIYLVWSVSSRGHVAPQRQGRTSSTAVRSNLHFTDRKTGTRPGTERVFMVQGTVFQVNACPARKAARSAPHRLLVSEWETRTAKVVLLGRLISYQIFM